MAGYGVRVIDTSAHTTEEIPLFPLGSVLFTEGTLPLKIFEPRYLDMIGRCLREDIGFGVVLIREGQDARQAADDPQPTIFTVGTYATIVDFHEIKGGFLGVIAKGGPKFRVRSTQIQDDHLMLGEVEFLPEERLQSVGAEHAPLVEILKELMEHPVVQKLDIAVDFDDARSVSWRLAELLPLEPEIKQSLLQMHLPRERLAELSRLVNNMRT